MLLTLPLLLATAQAQDETPAPPDDASTPSRARSFLMEVGFRGRYMDVPDGLVDLAYFRNTDDDTIPDRPRIRA